MLGDLVEIVSDLVDAPQLPKDLPFIVNDDRKPRDFTMEEHAATKAVRRFH